MRSGLERRLPGVRLEAEPAPIREALPRMDIAAFVGFASCGPLHLPVAIEDMTQFEAIFGPDALLAWDPLRGERARSVLGPAVHSFFANGGRRCWVIRVAGPRARSNCFPLPGLAVVRFKENGELAGIEPAFARARSEGSWSDGFESATGLTVKAFRVSNLYQEGRVIELPGTCESAPRPGDLLRLTFRDSGSTWLLFAPVETATTISQGSPPVSTVRLETTRPLWFEPVNRTHLPHAGSTVGVVLFGAQCSESGNESEPPPEAQTSPALPYRSTTVPCGGTLEWPLDFPNLRLCLQVSPTSVPSPGALLGLDVPSGSPPSASPSIKERWWFTVEDVAIGKDHASPLQESVILSGQAVRKIPVPAAPPGSISSAEVLEFDLRVRRGLSESYTLRHLGFAPGHPDYWDALPTDQAFYGPQQSPFLQGEVEQSFELEPRGLGRTPRGMRFPLAGMAVPQAGFIPLGIDGSLSRYLGRVRDDEDALTRDGLACFEASLFLDKDLAEVGTEDLMAQADFLRYLSPDRRLLHGIHAALGADASSVIDEVTLIAVPDAVQRGWKTPDLPRQDLTSPEHWWHVLPGPEEPPPLSGNRFLDCFVEVLEAPIFQEGRPPDQSGTFLLRWTPVTAATVYQLEEAAFSDFSGAVAVYRDKLREATLYGRSRGSYFYRVRAQRGSVASPWSEPIEVLVGAASGPLMESPKSYHDDTLLAVQRALLRMCAGRGDLLAVMALPQHYRENEAVAYLQELKRLAEKAEPSPTVRPLGRTEARCFSHGALYHPWLVTRTAAGILQSFPPDGAAAGLLAARGISRGAWVAPANEPLREVVALAPPIAKTNWQRLQTAQINIVRHDPRGFLVLSADTLSDDEDLRPISVRRLLILLRRLALRRGAFYVFEPLNDVFRRMVQRGFEAMLQQLYERGAFMGATPAASYQVITDSEINTPQSLDRGQFFVELRVAPSLPMTFITVRLIQAGDRLLAVEAR